MLAVLGAGKFPIYLDQLEILGVFDEGIPKTFLDYTTELSRRKKKGLSLVMYEYNFKGLPLRRRFLLNGRAYNPETEKDEFVPRRTYIYPEGSDYEEFPQNALVQGVRLQAKKLVFVPLVLLRLLTDDEVPVVQKWVQLQMKDLHIQEQLELLSDLNVQIQSQTVLANNQIALHLRDSDLRERDQWYWVLVNSYGQFQATNVCITPADQLYLIELILLLREQYSLHIYSPNNYPWIQL